VPASDQKEPSVDTVVVHSPETLFKIARKRSLGLEDVNPQIVDKNQIILGRSSRFTFICRVRDPGVEGLV
jgi:hypothetical protein